MTAALRVITAGELSGDTAQSSGMRRSAAISGAQVGAGQLWMGRTVMAPGGRSADHHHGDSETGIYVVSGTPAFAFRDPETGADRPAADRPWRLRLGAAARAAPGGEPVAGHRGRAGRRPVHPGSDRGQPARALRPAGYGSAATSSLTGLRRPV